MAERQKSRLYSNGNPVPESIVLQDGYCSEHFIYDYENEDQTEGYPSISDEDVEKKLRGVIGSGQEHSTVDLFLKAKLLMLAAINSYCSQEATGGNPIIIQGIKYEAHQTVPESQTGQIDERFRKSCKDENGPLSHLADNHDGLSGYECRMLQHFVFRYARRTAKPPVELVLVDHRPDHTPRTVNGI